MYAISIGFPVGFLYSFLHKPLMAQFDIKLMQVKFSASCLNQIKNKILPFGGGGFRTENR
jgi:hypothetical protein